jgi:hypothetical protein
VLQIRKLFFQSGNPIRKRIRIIQPIAIFRKQKEICFANTYEKIFCEAKIKLYVNTHSNQFLTHADPDPEVDPAADRGSKTRR